MLVNIQFLRFLAAMLVVIYHTAPLVPSGESAPHGVFHFGRSIGFAGVDVFFVISGFIMAYTTRDVRGARAAGKFTGRRLARIFSGHWPFFLMALLVFSWTRPEHVAGSNLIASFFLWPQPLNRTLLEITWTLTFELYFYLLFTLLVWFSPVRVRARICTLIIALLLLLTLYRHFHMHSFDPENLFRMSLTHHFLLSPFILEFFAGALVAYRVLENPSGPSWSLVLIGTSMFLAGSLFNQLVFDGGIEQGYFVVPRTLWFGTASILLVFGLVRLDYRSVKAPLSFSLSAGGASYAIYLSHILWLELARKSGLAQMISTWHFGLASISYFLLMAAIAGLGILHYRRVERPLHQLFKRALGVAQN